MLYKIENQINYGYVLVEGNTPEHAVENMLKATHNEKKLISCFQITETTWNATIQNGYRFTITIQGK